jgi:NAD(P)-dependent dehydrogenase (short-subunit alcohol dehydrogenase family)
MLCTCTTTNIHKSTSHRYRFDASWKVKPPLLPEQALELAKLSPSRLEPQWQKVIDVNLTGQFLCAREAVREFRRHGVRPEISCAAGKIICISSVHEVIPWAGHVNYAASKGGVMLMMKSIAQEVAPWRIRVNSIAPGAIRTPINMQAWDTPEHSQNF